MRILIAVIILNLTLVATGHAADIEGSADHPLVPRYEDSEIVAYATEAFTDYRLLNAKAENYGGLEKNHASTIVLEGKMARISYRAPAERSVLEVFRNYENALAEAGFETIFACDREACGGRNFNHVQWSGDLYSLFGDYHAEQRYLAARLKRAEGDVYVGLYAVENKAGGGPNKDRTMVQLDVVELQPMEEKMVLLDAGALETGLSSEGKIAVYGILFDFDKADIRPDSKPQLEEIARLLNDRPDLEVLIVGHTDNKGTLDYNQALSARRAQAVVDVLAGSYGIDAARLMPVGAGMAAPVATNRTEDERAANRRVEIVER
ncbi:OmpA family protein [Mesorhizobium xinjiangense]|uniref:OmpA family protein n=1 Tax=Mesorhizobium xinjiangense TaxID=2678685 RepID=UPI0012ED516D|nr:OmpA family protein [Mesorhizobium xinjiangense]